VDQYATRFGYNDDVIVYEDFLAYISALDAEFLKVMGEEIARKQKQAEKQRSR
jgi:hypothetical protein